MPEPIASWPRPRFTAAGGAPFLFYVVYGPISTAAPLTAPTYRVSEVPRELDLGVYGSRTHQAVLDSFRSGYVWDEFVRTDPTLAATVASQDACIVLRGEFPDSPNLDYLRNTIGLITYLLDRGGVAVYDPQMFRWWAPQRWRKMIFDPAAAVPHRHAIILTSAEPDGSEWIHTRGLRKFGRPDLSFPRVPAILKSGVIEACERFIEFQALGGIVAEGTELKTAALPAGFRCYQRGSLDDPDFNNVHLSIERDVEPSSSKE